ncbi:MAG TPA: STAS domain-containing protein [Nonomuraea sp.]|nr:STAS domain-containing protein [Nonomuraea sp.]
MTELVLRVIERPTCDVVCLDGELDLATETRLRRACADLLQRHHARIVMDVGGLDFCDCAGLAVLINVQGEAERQGGFLRLVGVHGPLARLLTAAELVDTFPPYSDLRQACG